MSLYSADWIPKSNDVDGPGQLDIQVRDVIDPDAGRISFYNLDDEDGGTVDSAWITVNSDVVESLEAQR